jgi:hypothetical protein
MKERKKERKERREEREREERKERKLREMREMTIERTPETHWKNLKELLKKNFLERRFCYLVAVRGGELKNFVKLFNNNTFDCLLVCFL